jgi:hypothetical protein
LKIKKTTHRIDTSMVRKRSKRRRKTCQLKGLKRAEKRVRALALS